jgi:hypothetical protein
MNTDDLIKTLAQDTAIPNHHWVTTVGFCVLHRGPILHHDGVAYPGSEAKL